MGTRVSGEPASVQGTAFRTVGFALALIVYGAISPCAIGQAAGVSTFHDDALNITYFYSAHFVQESSGAPVAPGDESKCIKPSLFANSAADRSSFTLYTIDDTCPALLPRATDLGLFTRDRVLVRLKQYGVPTIIQAPLSYSIAGHPRRRRHSLCDYGGKCGQSGTDNLCRRSMFIGKHRKQEAQTIGTD